MRIFISYLNLDVNVINKHNEGVNNREYSFIKEKPIASNLVI